MATFQEALDEALSYFPITEVAHGHEDAEKPKQPWMVVNGHMFVLDFTEVKKKIAHSVDELIIGEDDVIPTIPAGGDARYVDEYQKAYGQLKFKQRKALRGES